MQPLNNDMEELFREAAENYPLETGSADWSKVQQGLQAAGREADGIPDKKDKRHYAWLLLLLLIPLICNRFTGNDQADKGTGHTNSTEKKPAAVVSGNNVQPQPAGQKEAVAKDTKAEQSTGTYRKKEHIADEGIMQITLSRKDLDDIEKSLAARLLKRQQNKNDRSGIVARQNGEGQSSNVNTDNYYTSAADTTETKQVPANTGTVVTKDPVKHETPNDVSRELVMPSMPIKHGDSASAGLKPEPAPTDSAAASRVKSKQKKLYLTLLAGPDLSKVKSGTIKGIRGSAGITAGYSFTRRWSVETGVLWADKQYQTDGKYFNTDKANLPMHTIVLDAEGICRIIELPLTIRYRFASAKSHAWSAFSGLSSYFMKKEAYDYWYSRYNMKYYAEKEYKNSGTDLFSVLQIGAGYQTTIGRSASLRIDPYLKVPLKGIGIGQLPLLSTGVYVGLIIPVH